MPERIQIMQINESLYGCPTATGAFAKSIQVSHEAYLSDDASSP